jgi:hypothetical protein
MNRLPKFQGGHALGLFIQQRLKEIHTTQASFASSLGLLPSQASMLIRGNWKPTQQWAIQRLPLMATFLECDSDQLALLIRESLSEPVRAPRKRKSYQIPTINKEILKALAEQEDTTQETIRKLVRIECVMGTRLSYDTCKRLIKDLMAGVPIG